MINAEFAFNFETFEASLVVKGHASFDEIGKDIVCASASILTYTLANMMLDMHERGRLVEYPVIRLEGGDAIVECKSKDKLAYTRVLDAYQFTLAGFGLLAENYPQNVNVLG